MNKTLIFFLLFFSKLSFGQIEIGWKDLEDIEFSETFIDSLDEYVLFPNFGPEVLELSGKKVAISGYILEIDIGYYILSKGPFILLFAVLVAQKLLRIKFKVRRYFFCHG